MSSKEMTEVNLGYKPEKENLNRYMRAKDEYESRVGNAIKAKFNWQRIAFISLVICLISVLGIVFMSTKASVIPLVITVNNDGIPTVIGKADIQKHLPQDPEIRYFLGQFIYKARSVPLDPVLAKNNKNTLFYFMEKGSAQKLDKMLVQEGVNLKFGKEVVDVKVKSIVPFSEKNTYQIRWTETTFDLDGTFLEEKNMASIISIKCMPPKDMEKILVNPLGLFIKDFNWSPDV